MQRYQIIFQGQVQHVGFRNFCHLQALHHLLTGYVINLDNGMVCLQIQGEKKNIQDCLKKILAGNQFIKVTDYSMKAISVIADETKFIVK
ncbi:MAG: acylphosphatase [Erysipelotrichaceae bacterium]